MQDPVRARGIMEVVLRAAIALALGAGAAAAIAACGSSNAAHVLPITETVTNTVTQTVPATTPSTATSSATATTRTQSSPAFTGGTPAGSTSSSGDLSAAAASLTSRGYTPVSTATYNPSDTLRVLVGSAGAGNERAFFFEQGHYLGTDTSTPSAAIAVVDQNDTTVTLRYQLAGGGSQTVRFQLDQGSLVPLDPIPSQAARR